MKVIPISKQELSSRLSQLRNENAPYQVSIRGDTLTLELNLADAKWYTLFQKNGLKRTFKIHVAFNEIDHSAIVDSEDFEMSWHAGVPSIGFRIRWSRGEQYLFESASEWGIKENLRSVGQVYDYSLNSAAALKQVRNIIKSSGWKVKKSITTKLAITFGILGLVIAVISLIRTL